MHTNPKCPLCQSKTWKKGTRRGKTKYHCQSCLRWFQVNHRQEQVSAKTLLVQHLSGIPFRGLARLHQCGTTTAYRKVRQGLTELPTCIDVTRWYCQRFHGVLLVDGKYVKIKHYDRKLPVLYGVDYQTHDIPHYRLTRAEDYLNCKKFFESLKLTDYPLRVVVCDDNNSIYTAASYVFPKIVIQICHVHFLRNVRYSLDLQHNQYHQLFYPVLTKLLIEKRSKDDFDKKARTIYTQFMDDDVCTAIMLDLAKKQHLLQGYLHHKGTPTTTNLIESMNSHLEARVKPLKGFESFKHANLWLNGYFLQRRVKKFTDCSRKFKRLNGKTSLEIVKKPGVDIPSFF